MCAVGCVGCVGGLSRLWRVSVEDVRGSASCAVSVSARCLSVSVTHSAAACPAVAAAARGSADPALFPYRPVSSAPAPAKSQERGYRSLPPNPAGMERSQTKLSAVLQAGPGGIGGTGLTESSFKPN